MKLVGLELYCAECGTELRFDDEASDEANEADNCPRCGNRMHRNCFITCDCGTTVYLDNSLTNECPPAASCITPLGRSLPRGKNGAKIFTMTAIKPQIYGCHEATRRSKTLGSSGSLPESNSSSGKWSSMNSPYTSPRKQNE